MNSNYIKRILYSHYANCDYRLFNTFVFRFESDFIFRTKSGYFVEVEIKVSRSDFFADFKKEKYGVDKHEYLQSENTYKPNRFYFATPKGLIKPNEIPKYAGLIEVSEGCFYETKRAPFLHKEDLMKDKRFLKSLLDKFYYRNIDLRNELNIREYEIKYGVGKLKLY